MDGVVKLLFGGVEKTFNGAKNFFVFICQGILDFLFDKIKSLFIHIIMIVRKKLDFLLFNNIKKIIFINNFFLTSIRNILLTMNIYTKYQAKQLLFCGMFIDLYNDMVCFFI